MTAYQLDLASPSGAEPIPVPDEPSDRFDLRHRVWQHIGGEQSALYAVAERAGVSSYALTKWLRGEVELGGREIGCLYAITRGAM